MTNTFTPAPPAPLPYPTKFPAAVRSPNAGDPNLIIGISAAGNVATVVYAAPGVTDFGGVNGSVQIATIAGWSEWKGTVTQVY